MDILVCEMTQNNVGREVGDAQMLRRKDARLRRNIALVVGNGTMTDNQASDVQVERSMAVVSFEASESSTNWMFIGLLASCL